MKRKLLAVLVALGMLLPAIAHFVDDIKVDIKAGKFKEENSELFGYNEGDEKLFFYTNGTVELTAKVPAAGDYTIVVSASCTAAEKKNATFTLKVDDKEIVKNHSLTTEDQKDYSFDAKLTDGERKIYITFTNDTYKEGEYDLNLFVHGVTIKKKK